MKRIVSVLLSLCMAVCMFGTTAFAAEAEPAAAEPAAASYSTTAKTALWAKGNSIVKPQIILTFKSGPTTVLTVPLVQGEGPKTIHVPTTFCLARNVIDVDSWKPVDPISFNSTEIKAGTDLTLDYESARELFGVRFAWTVIKMVGC